MQKNACDSLERFNIMMVTGGGSDGRLSVRGFSSHSVFVQG